MLMGLGAGTTLIALFAPAPPLMSWPPVLNYGTFGIIAGVVYLLSERNRVPTDQRPLRPIVFWLATAIVTLIVYSVLLNLWSVVDPQTERVRFQIGFGLADWSLTDLGRRVKSQFPSLTAAQLLMTDKGFHMGGSTGIWERWSVYSAGFLLIGLYLAAFISWTIALALSAARLLDAGVRGRPGGKARPA